MRGIIAQSYRDTNESAHVRSLGKQKKEAMYI